MLIKNKNFGIYLVFFIFISSILEKYENMRSEYFVNKLTKCIYIQYLRQSKSILIVYVLHKQKRRITKNIPKKEFFRYQNFPFSY